MLAALRDTSTRMALIKGLRRTGKTSLLNVVLAESGLAYAKIDVREGPYYDQQAFLAFFVSKIKARLGKTAWDRVRDQIKSIEFSYGELSATVLLAKEENLHLFFQSLEKDLKKNATTFVLAFDEVQLLKKIKFDYILASLFDNYPHIKIILTGSEIGMVDDFIGKQQAEAPLFGRALLEIELARLSPQETMRFLELGFSQIKKQVSFQEMKDVVEQLDGIIGWATSYGWLRSQGIAHEKALEKVIEEGKVIVLREFQHFLESRRAKERYTKIIHSLAHGQHTWQDLKLSGKKAIADSQLVIYLHELMAYGFVEKTEGKYHLSDPLLLKAMRE